MMKKLWYEPPTAKSTGREGTWCGSGPKLSEIDLAEHHQHAEQREDRREERRALLHQRPHRDALGRPADQQHESQHRCHADRIGQFDL